jgi:hypothetical protein
VTRLPNWRSLDVGLNGERVSLRRARGGSGGTEGTPR